ncbi:GNAT family N-acetyltransferase [Calidifontibacter terrae]
MIRDARPDDAAACAAIYAPYVRDTCISFEQTPPDEVELAARIAANQKAHAWLVAQEAGRVVGYAYGSPHRAREAYRFATDVSAYLDVEARGRGVGPALYGALLDRLADLGYRMACAGIALPNERSERFHRGMGFEEVGIYRRIGWKFDAWRDVLWLQRPLGDDPAARPLR